MRVLLRFVVVIVLPVALILNGHYAAAALIWVAFAGMWAFSVVFLPWVPCLVCHGSGMRSHGSVLGFFFPRAFGPCWLCKGAKGWVRLSVRLLQPERAARIALTR